MNEHHPHTGRTRKDVTTLPLPFSSTARSTRALPLLASVTRFVVRIVLFESIIVLLIVVSVHRRGLLRFRTLGLGRGGDVLWSNGRAGVDQTAGTEPFASRDGVERWDQAPQMIWRVALKKGVNTERPGDQRGTRPNLITLQRRIVFSVILATDDTFLGGIEFCRMPRQIGKLVARPGEEEGRVLARRDPGFGRFPSRKRLRSRGV